MPIPYFSICRNNTEKWSSFVQQRSILGSDYGFLVKMRELLEHEKSWLAAAIDGEGC